LIKIELTGTVLPIELEEVQAERSGYDISGFDFRPQPARQGCALHSAGEEALKQAMAVYTAWRDGQLGNVDQGAVSDFCQF